MLPKFNHFYSMSQKIYPTPCGFLKLFLKRLRVFKNKILHASCTFTFMLSYKILFNYHQL